jgi:hypothetical protein
MKALRFSPVREELDWKKAFAARMVKIPGKRQIPFRGDPRMWLSAPVPVLAASCRPI